MKELSDTDKIIKKLFSERWTANLAKAPVKEMRKQLRKNLQDQLNGFWSGNSAYSIMVDGGFLIDSRRVYIGTTNRAKGKKLTLLGQMFMDSMAKA